MRIEALERDIQQSILDYLAFEHIWAIRLNTVATVLKDANGKSRFVRSHSAGAGTADILALVEMVNEGFMPLWIEVKTETGEQSDKQSIFQKDVERRGHRYIIARSIEDVRNAVQGIA